MRVCVWIFLLLSAATALGADDISCSALYNQFTALELDNIKNSQNRLPMCTEKITVHCCPTELNRIGTKEDCSAKELELYYQNLLAEVELLEGFGKVSTTLEGQHSLIKNENQKIDQKINHINQFVQTLEKAEILQQTLLQNDFWINFYKQDKKIDHYIVTYCQQHENEIDFCQNYNNSKDKIALIDFLKQFADAENNYLSTNPSKDQTKRYEEYAGYLFLNNSRLNDYKNSEEFKKVQNLKEKALSYQTDKTLTNDELKDLIDLSSKIESIKLSGSELTDETIPSYNIIQALKQQSEKINSLNTQLTGKEIITPDLSKLVNNLNQNINEQNSFLNKLSQEAGGEMKEDDGVCTINGCSEANSSMYQVYDFVFQHNRSKDLKEKTETINLCLKSAKNIKDMKRCYSNTLTTSFNKEEFLKKKQALEFAKNTLQFALNEHPQISRQEKIKYLTVKALKENHCFLDEKTNHEISICNQNHKQIHDTIGGFIADSKKIFLNYENSELQKLMNLKEGDYKSYSEKALSLLENCEDDKYSALCAQLKKEATQYKRSLYVRKSYEPLPTKKLAKPSMSTGAAIASGTFVGVTKSLPSVMQFFAFKNQTKTLINSYENYNTYMTQWNAANPNTIYIMPDYNNPMYQSSNSSTKYWNPSNFRMPNLNFGSYSPDVTINSAFVETP